MIHNSRWSRGSGSNRCRSLVFHFTSGDEAGRQTGLPDPATICLLAEGFFQTHPHFRCLSLIAPPQLAPSRSLFLRSSLTWCVHQGQIGLPRTRKSSMRACESGYHEIDHVSGRTRVVIPFSLCLRQIHFNFPLSGACSPAPNMESACLVTVPV